MAGPGFKLRVADERDIGALLALWTSPDVHPTMTDGPEAVAALMRHQPGSVVVAVGDDGDIVGSVIAGWDGWRGSLYRLAVSPTARRHGVGTALVSHAVTLLGDRGCSRVGILVVEADAGAVAFWNHCTELGILVDPAPKVRYISNLT
ncbi:MAG: GNAT family N-acetyltransferase [Candidatus Dormibacteria bacterium]